MTWLYGGLSAIIMYVGVLAYSNINKIATLSTELAEAKHKLNLTDYREASFRRMTDRRDRAIAASQCAKQIQYWVRHPDEIPKKFAPFKQLEPENTR
ncbi:hypothetical protein [Hyphomicrobium sp.]|uniref:hypothetical protein n=1 Tax=Hyphomicrobium sp. TaxID=82 RepID=UPI001E032894|nr:hypothetical protein [Hyphomicrobium sp.]MBY0560026.1 hypothetical protein [Hyphomicrobium sp.]